jgi:hypothetical protein
VDRKSLVKVGVKRATDSIFGLRLLQNASVVSGGKADLANMHSVESALPKNSGSASWQSLIEQEFDHRVR